MQKFFSLTTCVALVVGVVCAETVKRPIDDAFFVMGLRGESAGAITTSATTTQIYDQLNWSGNSSITAYGVQPSADYPNLLTNYVFAPPIHAMTTNSAPCLYLPQYAYQDENNDWWIGRNIVRINNAASSSLTQTFFVRFRWDGAPVNQYTGHEQIFNSAYDWGNKSGVILYIDNNSGNPASGSLKLQIMNDQNISATSVTTGKWYDVFCTIRPVEGDSTKTYAEVCSIATPNGAWTTDTPPQYYFTKPTMTIKTRTADKVTKFNTASYPYVCFGTENGGTTGFVKHGGSSSAQANLFRGAIAAYASWNRILTQDEMWQVASGFHGSNWACGAVNGKADEFAAATETVADEFCVTGQWRFCRRELTADHPSLKLRGPMPPTFADLGHWFTLVPLFDGSVGAACPVEITVCGQKLRGTYDLRDREGRNVYIADKYWTRDAQGDVTVEVKRVGEVTGTVSIDAFMLSGSWCLGKVDGVNDGPSETQIVSTYWLGDQAYSAHRQRGLCFAQAYSTETVKMYLPPEVGGLDWRYSLETKTLSMISGLPGHMAVACYVNGKLVDTATDLDKNASVSIDVPHEGFFVPGMNTVVFSNASDGAYGQRNNWCNIDFYRLRIRDRRHGAMLILK